MKLFVALAVTFVVSGSCVASGPADTPKNIKPTSRTIWEIAPKQKIQALQPGQVIIFPPAQPIPKQMPAHEKSATIEALRTIAQSPFTKIAVGVLLPTVGIGVGKKALAPLPSSQYLEHHSPQYFPQEPPFPLPKQLDE
jgi:hypothetical protein